VVVLSSPAHHARGDRRAVDRAGGGRSRHCGGSYVGPGGWQEFTGYPVVLRLSERARDPGLQRRLWQESERLTGVSYQFSIATV
jgi:hypothetical protein